MTSDAPLIGEQQACWQRFEAAAVAAQRGDYRLAQALVAQVKQQAGEGVAQQQRRELWNYAKYLRRQRALDIPPRRARKSA